MKKLYTFLLLFTVTFTYAQVEGTWKMSPQAASFGVGPEFGDISWWSNSEEDITTRACYFDDLYVFNTDGSFNNVMDNETWVEGWQGVDPQGCAVPVAPHDGSNAATWTYDDVESTVTLNGVGAYIGLPKVFNGGELSNPADAPESIFYPLVFSADGDTMTINISIGGGWWRFILVKVQEESPYSVEGTWKMAPQAAALGVGPDFGDISWWSNSEVDVTTRECYFNDKYVFSSDGTFSNVQDEDTWIEGWQGMDPEGCGAPVAPHDGSNAATWTYDASESTVTLNGVGAYLGLPKVFNGGELSNPADAPESIFYPLVFSADGDTMTINISIGGGWWRYIMVRAEEENDYSVEGTWAMAPQAAALGVGPEFGDISWWSNSETDVTTRECYFNDRYVFDSDGTFSNVQGDDTWIEGWQGMDPEGCGTPVAPHDGSNAATWTFDETESTVTLTGVGAYLGLPKVFNGGELSNPADAPESIFYPLVFSADGDTMTINISIGGGWWRYIMVRAEGTGIAETASFTQTKVFPNPVSDVLNIENARDFDEVRIYSITGKLVYQSNKVETSVNVENLPAGFYTLIASGFDGKNYQARFIVK